MDTEKISKKLEVFEKDSDWFYDNVNELINLGLTNMHVAVKGGKVIASDENINNVIRKLKEQGEDPAFIVVNFVYPKGVVLRL